MNHFEALERIDVSRILSEADQLLRVGDAQKFEKLVHALEASRQRYVEIERQSTEAVRQLEPAFDTIRGELAYNPAAVQQYREMQLTLDMYLSRLQAGRREAEAIASILLKLRPELERFAGRRKVIDLAARAREVKAELGQLKQAFLPAFEQLVEKIFALNRDAAAFNHTVSLAQLPQTHFLQCRIDLMQLLAAFAELDIVVTPEMEQLAAEVQRAEQGATNGRPGSSASEFEAPEFLAQDDCLTRRLDDRNDEPAVGPTDWHYRAAPVVS